MSWKDLSLLWIRYMTCRGMYVAYVFCGIGYIGIVCIRFCNSVRVHMRKDTTPTAYLTLSCFVFIGCQSRTSLIAFSEIYETPWGICYYQTPIFTSEGFRCNIAYVLTIISICNHWWNSADSHRLTRNRSHSYM